MTSTADALVALKHEFSELYNCTSVDVVDAAPSPLTFHRDYVAPNKPLVIRNAITHWPALKLWQDSSRLTELLGTKPIPVEVTPTGRADAVVGERVFVTPSQHRVPVGEFLDVLGNQQRETAVYVSSQNGNLTGEMPELLVDVEGDIPWASEAFGAKPDAVNVWMGESRAVTSCHKDHYENLYAVISGTKTFTLFPPVDSPFLYERPYQTAQYTAPTCPTNRIPLRRDEMCVREGPQGERVAWVSVDPDSPDLEKYPLYRHATPIRVTLHPGDLLYLPSLYFHQVAQTQTHPSHPVIAVNFWYDMAFDIKYVYWTFMRSVAALCEPHITEPEEGRDVSLGEL